MNKLLLALLLVSSIAQAQSWEMKNDAGGKIIATDTLCTNESNKYVIFAQDSAGHVLFGCWFFAEGYVMTTWADGTLRSYSANDFIKRK